MNEKKYFWFKLEDDFFQKKEIKKLRSIAGGDTYVIIYLKIILLSLKTGGKLYFENIDDEFASEIALTIDEESINVQLTLDFLFKHCSITQIDDNEYHVNIGNLIGSETSTAIRVRKHREKKKNFEKIEEKEKMLLCNNFVTPLKQNDNGEIELEKEIEKEIEKEKKEKELFVVVKNIFYTVYPELNNGNIPDFTKTDFGVIKNIVKRAITFSDTPEQYVSGKIQTLKNKCMTSNNNFWTFTPQKLMYAWNDLVPAGNINLNDEDFDNIKWEMKK